MGNSNNLGSAPSSRQLKAGEVIRRALAEVFISGKLLDAYIGDTPITVSEVRVSPDLKNATAFVVPFGNLDKDLFMQSLERIKSALRKMVTGKVSFKFSPELHFKFDDSFERASKMHEMIREATEEVK